MGHSSLLGTDLADAEPAGRDTAALGPGDNSDSGSDVAGLEQQDTEDTTLPVDVAMRDDAHHNLMPAEALHGSASDASGTGERRSAGSDAGSEAADIGIDRIFTPGAEEGDGDGDEDEDADLEFIDRAEAGDPLEDEEEAEIDRVAEDAEDDDSEQAVPSNDAHRGTSPRGMASPTSPARKSPEPNVPGGPVDPDGEEDEDLPDDEGDAEQRQPGRS